MTRVLGIDPGLARTGWGLVDVEGSRLRPVACGTIVTNEKSPVYERLVVIHKGLEQMIALWQPDEAAVEETFVNTNAKSTLKLGLARGVAMVIPALLGIKVAEYSANFVKKAVVGVGHAGKDQVEMMVRRLLPGIDIKSADAADALAVAICHAHLGQSQKFMEKVKRS